MKSLLLPPLGLWFNWRLEGLDSVPETGPLIVVGNHLSYFDPLAHAYFVVKAGRRPRFLAKRELFDNRVVGTVLRGVRQIPVDRGKGDASPLQDAKLALESGEVVVVYPEGTSTTTNEDFSPGPGKTGAVRLALMTGVPILPVATWGGQYVWRKTGREGLEFGRPILLRAGSLFDPAARAGAGADPPAVRAMTDELMGELAELVAALATRYPARWSGSRVAKRAAGDGSEGTTG